MDGIIHKLVTVFATLCFLPGKLLSAAPGYAQCQPESFITGINSLASIKVYNETAPLHVPNFATGINLQLRPNSYSHRACIQDNLYREGKNRAVLRSLGWYQDLIIKRKILLQPPFTQ